jgi:hypothetical protein
MSEFPQTPPTPRAMPTVTTQVPYEPPRVDRVLTEEELEGEVLYGGTTQLSPVEW